MVGMKFTTSNQFYRTAVQHWSELTSYGTTRWEKCKNWWRAWGVLCGCLCAWLWVTILIFLFFGGQRPQTRIFVDEKELPDKTRFDCSIKYPNRREYVLYNIVFPFFITQGRYFGLCEGRGKNKEFVTLTKASSMSSSNQKFWIKLRVLDFWDLSKNVVFTPYSMNFSARGAYATPGRRTIVVENWAESGVFILDQVRNARLLQKPTEPLSLLLSQPAMLSTLHA